MVKPIKKDELVTDIAALAGISKAQANAALDATIEAITARLVAGDTVALPGLVKMETRDRPARQVRNVSNGEMMDKEADRAVKMSALTAIKTSVNL